MFEFLINPPNLLIIASVFIGLTFGLLLILTDRVNRRANILLGLLSFIIVFWNIWVLSVDFRVFEHYPWFCLIPLNYSLALGPLLYLYTRKITNASFIFRVKHLLHFAPVILELIFHFMIATKAIDSGIRPVDSMIFANLIPIIQLLALSSIIIYTLKALQEIGKYHKWLKANYSNDRQYQLRWLYRLIIIFAALWVMLVPYTVVDYFFFDFQLTIADYYPIYILMSIITIWISAEAFLRPEVVFLEPNVVEANGEKESNLNFHLESNWLRNEMARNQYFLDPEMTLRKLAEELDLHPNHLSKVINSGISKNFADFINQYRVDSVISRINDPKYDHITLLGISFECGFNSKTTFNRVFKNITGKTPFQFKKMGSNM